MKGDKRAPRPVILQIFNKLESDVISFDGKTMRGTASQENGLKAVHMLNAWSHERGICIGHMKVDDKSNEIPAVPQLMELLDLKGTVITTDAMNTQKKTASAAIKLGADYVLPVKENQASLLEEVEFLFKEVQDKKFQGIDADDFETAEKGHGRVEIRTYVSMDGSDLAKENTLKCGKAGKRVAAATDPVYREKLIKLFL